MKEKLTLRNIILWSGALFGLVAFFISFAAKLSLIQAGEQGFYNNIIWGCDSLTVHGVTEPVSKFEGMSGVKHLDPAVVPLVGIILILVGAIAAVVVSLFLNKPWTKWVVVGCAAVVLAGSIMQFFAFDGFVRGYVSTIAKLEGETDKAKIEQVVQELKAQFSNYSPKTTVSTIMGILGIAGSLAVGVSQFLPEKK